MPAIKPFFIGALSFNSRRPKVEGDSLAFKTPEKWINHPAIKREYTGMIFDRKKKHEINGDLIGIGHPLMARAMQQAESFIGVIAIARGLDQPVLVLQISDRVTDGGSHVQKVIIGMTALDTDFEFLRDWQLLLLLNKLNTNNVDEKLPDSLHTANWIQRAKMAGSHHISKLDLPFEVPDIRELILLWPSDLKSTFF